MSAVEPRPWRELAALRDLTALPRWVLWKRAKRGTTVTKVPLRTTGEVASSTDAATWSTFRDCWNAYEDGRADGLGFVLDNDGLVGVDLDHCLGDDGTLAPWAARIVSTLASYTEVSPSGRGLRIFARGTLPPVGRKRGHIEMYDRGRFLTVTAQHLPGSPDAIEERTAALARAHQSVFGPAHGSPVPVPRPPSAPIEPDDLARLVGDVSKDCEIARLLHERHDALARPSESDCDFAVAKRLLDRGTTPDNVESLLRWRRGGDGKDRPVFSAHR